MIEFEIKSKVQPIGTRKGQTVYFAQPKSQQYFTNKMLIERIVRETSMSEGDVKNALVSLSNVVCEAMTLGMSVDLAELGSFRLVFQDDGHAGRCDGGQGVEDPENRLHPQAEDARRRQRGGAEHRPQRREVFHEWRHHHRAGRRRNGRSAGVK